MVMMKARRVRCTDRTKGGDVKLDSWLHKATKFIFSSKLKLKHFNCLVFTAWTNLKIVKYCYKIHQRCRLGGGGGGPTSLILARV